MTAPAPETSLAAVLAAHAAMDVPEGFRAEVIEGNIVVSASPAGRHAWIVHRLTPVLERSGLAAVQNITIDLASTDERYVPDLAVLPEDALLTDDWLFEPHVIELAVEVVSPNNARTDRIVKTHGYASAGIPLFLLVDPLDREISLFSEPENGVYRQQVRVPFGKALELPEPLGVTLDTAAYADVL